MPKGRGLSLPDPGETWQREQVGRRKPLKCQGAGCQYKIGAVGASAGEPVTPTLYLWAPYRREMIDGRMVLALTARPRRGQGEGGISLESIRATKQLGIRCSCGHLNDLGVEPLQELARLVYNRNSSQEAAERS